MFHAFKGIGQILANYQFKWTKDRINIYLVDINTIVVIFSSYIINSPFLALGPIKMEMEF